MTNQTPADQIVRLDKNDLYYIVSIDELTETCVLRLEKNGETLFIQNFPLSGLRKPTEQ